MVLENEEESGSPNLINLISLAEPSIGKIDALFCMDSGVFDYNQIWITMGLRGVAIVDFSVEVGEQNYHSGEVGGIVPETFRIVRKLLDRLDDPKTGKVCDELMVELTDSKNEEADYIVKLAGTGLYTKYKVADGA